VKAGLERLNPRRERERRRDGVAFAQRCWRIGGCISAYYVETVPFFPAF
jgi:hypothetical protein